MPLTAAMAGTALLFGVAPSLNTTAFFALKQNSDTFSICALPVSLTQKVSLFQLQGDGADPRPHRAGIQPDQPHVDTTWHRESVGLSLHQVSSAPSVPRFLAS